MKKIITFTQSVSYEIETPRSLYPLTECDTVRAALQKTFKESGLRNREIVEMTGISKCEVSNIFAGQKAIRFERAVDLSIKIGKREAFLKELLLAMAYYINNRQIN
jgi:hypothetical protein